MTLYVYFNGQIDEIESDTLMMADKFKWPKYYGSYTYDDKATRDSARLGRYIDRADGEVWFKDCRMNDLPEPFRAWLLLQGVHDDL